MVISPLRGDEMADLVAYLDSVGYFASSGDAKKGQKLAGDKGCAVCHSVSDLGQTAGREFSSRQGPVEAPAMVISFAWNHSLLIEEAAGQATAAWRPLGADEMADLMAFVRWRGRERTRDGAYPGTIQAP